MANRVAALVGRGIGAWIYTRGMSTPKLEVKGKPQGEVFVEHSHTPRFDASLPTESVECVGELVEIEESNFTRVGYLGPGRIICNIIGG